MPLDVEKIWSDDFKSQVPNTNSKSSGISNFVKFVDSHTTNKLTLASPVGGKSTYTWQPDIFEAQLLSISPSTSQAVGAKLISDAWEAATLAGIMVIIGGFVGSLGPPTRWRVPPQITIVPASVQTAKAALFSALQKLAPTTEISNLPTEIRKAFLLIKFKMAGLNSVPPPSGPQPLVVTAAEVE